MALSTPSGCPKRPPTGPKVPPNCPKAEPECLKIKSQIRCVVYEAITIKNAF